MKKYIKKRTWILICILISLTMIFLSGCEEEKGDAKVASVKGALAYLKSEYGSSDFELKLLKVNDVAPYRGALFSIDGSTIYEDVPARTETCYLGYSPKDDLYFYVFHSTHSQMYSATLEGELAQIKKFDEVIEYARDVFGDKAKGTDVHLYVGETMPLYDENELKPIYPKSDIDARNAYNRLLLDIEDPFSSDIMHISKRGFRFRVIPYLNVYVDYPLEELKPKMSALLETPEKSGQVKTVFDKFESISLDALFIANDGIYKRRYLTIEMFNELK